MASVVVRHDDRRPYSTTLQGTYKAYLVFYKQVNLLGNLSTCCLPSDYIFTTWNKTRVISRIRASPSTPSPATRGQRRGRKPKNPVKRTSDTKKQIPAPKSPKPTTVTTPAGRPVTRSSAQKSSPTSASPTKKSTAMDSNTSADLSSPSSQALTDQSASTAANDEVAQPTSSTRPPLITPDPDNYPVDYDTEKYIDTSEDEDNASKGTS